MTTLVIGPDFKAPTVQGMRHVVIAASVLAKPMNHQHHTAYLKAFAAQLLG
jgi:hypothetical protein